MGFLCGDLAMLERNCIGRVETVHMKLTTGFVGPVVFSALMSEETMSDGDVRVLVVRRQWW